MQSLRNVLVVDDNPSVRKFIALSVTELGFNVHEAASGTEAILLCREHDFHAVLTDYQMPGMNGVELAQRLPADGGGRKIFLVTGSDISAREAGPIFHGLLKKPLTFTALASALGVEGV